MCTRNYGDLRPRIVDVKLNGEYLTKLQLAKDAFLTDEGRGVISVGWPRMCNLVRREGQEVHEVELISHG